MLSRARVGSSPSPEVEFAWGSRSTSSVRWPSSASAAPRLIAVVVLPTPPFWLTTARIGGVVVANILGLASSADPISGATIGILPQIPEPPYPPFSAPPPPLPGPSPPPPPPPPP